MSMKGGRVCNKSLRGFGCVCLLSHHISIMNMIIKMLMVIICEQKKTKIISNNQKHKRLHRNTMQKKTKNQTLTIYQEI